VQRARAAVAAAEARIGVPPGASLERVDVEQTPAVREAKAVLTEAAVRNYVLQLRGMDSMREFIERQSHQMQAVHDEDDRP
jgi:serine kinase of HPr protein (carbohydrate metabolism regulator)